MSCSTFLKVTLSSFESIITPYMSVLKVKEKVVYWDTNERITSADSIKILTHELKVIKDFRGPFYDIW